MTRMFKSDFLWRFVGGFALGTVALLGLQPSAMATTADLGIDAAASAR